MMKKVKGIFFSFFLKGKTHGYMGELGLEIIQQPFLAMVLEMLVGIS